MLKEYLKYNIQKYKLKYTNIQNRYYTIKKITIIIIQIYKKMYFNRTIGKPTLLRLKYLNLLIYYKLQHAHYNPEKCLLIRASRHRPNRAGLTHILSSESQAL